MIKKLPILFLLLVSAAMFSQGTSCATATPIAINGPCASGNLTDTTQDLPNITTCPTGTFRNEGWYTFTVTTTTPIIITGIGNNRNLFLQLISSTSACAGLTQINCANTTTTNGTQTETISTTLAPGIYYIKAVNVGSNGTLNLTSLCVISTNDECSGAIPLTVTSACNYITSTNIGATASLGIPAPGCANYSGGDVWFSAVVPATGILTVDMIQGTMIDSGMAFYTGTCAGLNLLECDDDDSSNGLMSYITRSGLTPGQTIYIRAWGYGTSTGTFGICATSPLCATPTINAVTNVTTSSATLNWGAITPAPSIGYEYVYSTTNITPTGSGTATTATTVNLSGLPANTTYYVFVRSNCGGGEYSPWTSSVTFTTGYCFSTSTSSTYYINSFSTSNGSTNVSNLGSGYSAGGYGNFLGQNVTQINGGTVNFNSVFVGGTFGFNIWVDWNNDLDFLDAGELVYSSGAYVTGATGSFTVPAGASAGNHRMRIKADYFNTNPTSCGSISNGETEDYTLIVGNPLPCSGNPTAVTVNLTSTSTASVSWNAASPVPANGYQYFLSTSASSPIATTTPTGSVTAGVTSLNLTGLTPSTTYYIWVRSNCSVALGQGTWVGPINFVTQYCASTSTSSTYYIRNFTTSGGILNINNNNSGYSTTGYGNFTSQVVSQINSGTVTFNATFFDGFYSYGFNIWIDWNNDLDFLDAGELVYSSGAYVTSATGSFIVPVGASIGNHRMRIKADYFNTNPTSCGTISSGETEDYTFNVSNPLPCGGNPSNIFVNIISSTSVIISWLAAVPAPTNGYQYYFSTSNTSPLSSTTPSGATGAGVTNVTLTGITAGSTYYVWVRSNCGGALGQGVWVGPISYYIPTCGIGPGTGTTTLDCPAVIAGGLGLNGADPNPVDCNSISSCVDLEATYLPIGQTTSYTVESIPYAPPYQFNCLKNAVSVNVDDVWSPTVNLPFNFCYYGNNYNQCTISSNGAITFDLASNTPGGYSTWSFSNNIPSTTLFLNSIFGVYHDIDPSLGGTVGWELITLNTGCRALVAAWNNIPMFSCTSSLYTGMIVLYENTNIIEVYIKEKNACSGWNSGNAVVGIQNSTGTQGVVAPNRNSLSADWSITNEAWRFVPAGTPLTTVTWYEGSGTSGPIVGTGDTVSVCPTRTTTYTAVVTYNLCTGLTFTETEESVVTVIIDKSWNGSVNSDWNINGNWTPPGVPTITNCVIVPLSTTYPIISGTNYNAYAKNVLVNTGASLTINTTNTFTVERSIYVEPNGIFKLNNGASLIQIFSGNINTGDIIMDRSTTIKNTDYVYWSSPVENFNSSAISPASFAGHIFKWNTTIANSNGGQGNWVSGIESMVAGKGYIIRAPLTYTSTPSAFTATFTGVPNNGTISTPISRGSHTGSNYFGSNGINITNLDDNWNLIGNPFPSAISATSFISNNSNIDGNVRLWTHNTSLLATNANPFYGTFGYNYSLNDYIVYNSLGSNPPGFNGYIGAGQGFFVTMIDGPPTTENVNFSNSLRSNTYPNTQFFRQANTENILIDTQKGRIWLDLVNSNNNSATTLIGYIENATIEKDRLFDAHYTLTTSFGIFSLIGDKQMIIQGRPVPFDEMDIVPLGISVPTNGSYSIGIHQVDGLFEDSNQNIFLEDNLLGIVHNLRNEPYSFSTTTGRIENRFVLRYTNSLLGIDPIKSEQTNAYIANGSLFVKAKENIKEVSIYDVSGKLIYKHISHENVNEFKDNFRFAKAIYFAKIVLENDTIVTKKIMN